MVANKQTNTSEKHDLLGGGNNITCLNIQLRVTVSIQPTTA